MGSLIDDLGSGPVCLDSAFVIFAVESHSGYRALVNATCEALAASDLFIFACELCLMEALVIPLRREDRALVERFEAFLDDGFVELVPLSREVLHIAAELRGEYPSLRTPDALHLATAHSLRCTAFLTNDLRLPAVKGVRIVSLQDHLP